MRFPDDVPMLTDGVVTLRAHSLADVEGIVEQCTDPLSRAWTTVPVPYSDEDALRFVTESIAPGWRGDSDWAFAVEAYDGGTPRFAGTVSLRNEGDLRAELAYGSHPWARGHGIMLRSLGLLLDWGFATKDLRSVIWWANRGNWSSRKLAWRLGFSFDGTVHRWLPQRGELHDAWVGVLLAGAPRAPNGTWFEVPRVVGESVVLRAHEDRDLVRIVEAGRDARTAYWLAGLPHPYTLQSAEEYLASRVEQRATGSGLSWAVADPETDLLLANIGVFDLENGDGAEIGYWTHPAARGRGVMTQACSLVVRHAFVPVEDGGLGLRRLKIFAAERNGASRHVIEANGFVATGRNRADTRLGDGSWVDTTTYDLLASEYDGSPPALR